jgi:hypothetical protein
MKVQNAEQNCHINLIFLESIVVTAYYYQTIFSAGLAVQGISIRIPQWLNGARTALSTPEGPPKDLTTLAKNDFDELGI